MPAAAQAAAVGRQAAGSFCAKRKPTYNVHTHMILQSADDGSAKLHNGRLVPFMNLSINLPTYFEVWTSLFLKTVNLFFTEIL